jgi:protein-disulfide isomerase-like protein with CxxC motif
MLPFSSTSQLTDTEVTIVTRAMLKVAQTDGVHPAEIALIRDFYQSGVETAGLPLFDDLLADAGAACPVDAARFSDSGNRDLLLTLCILTAYADGQCTDSEQAVLEGLAADMGVPSAHLAVLQAQVKDHLLASLAHLPDAASVAAVAHELG